MKFILKLNILLLSLILINGYENVTRSVRASSHCGVRMIGQRNIIGGVQVTYGEFPWMAVLMQNIAGGHRFYFCGGSLISNKRIVSAAHCMVERDRRLLPRDVTVILGGHDLDDIAEEGRIVRVLSKIFVHPDWNPFTPDSDGDISVLELARAVPFDAYIQPVCLWTSQRHLTVNSGVIVGYGKSENPSKKHENTPRKLEVPIHSNENCFLRFHELAILSSKRTFCAGKGNGRGACRGDSGHGLFINIDGVFFLFGITSASLLSDKYNWNCDVDKFSIFTNVLKFNSWVLNPSDFERRERVLATTRSSLRAFADDSEQYTTVASRALPPFIPERNVGCGIMSTPTGLIHGGAYTSRNIFPWLAIITIQNTHNGSGSLISKRHVVADAFSVSYIEDSTKRLKPLSRDRVKIFLGTTRVNDISQHGSVRRDVYRISIHPNARKMSDNLRTSSYAVITLARDVIFNDFIRPVCLWSFGDNLNAIVGKDAYVTGYGEDETGKDSLLRKHVRVTVTEQSVCEKNYKEEFYLARGRTKLFCVVGNEREGPCHNDNQLYMKVGSTWYLKAITSASFYFLRCFVYLPTLYEDVVPYVEWIHNEIK